MSGPLTTEERPGHELGLVTSDDANADTFVFKERRGSVGCCCTCIDCIFDGWGC